ncbi:epoxide hydrolase 4-like [Xenia sp. Carnegie-2017]|uniref:epoxide hydrolase 4-like n=1 Tax=Xenia sp. Carnegie-2017 TaxID=2897299 RepID=UPI001F04ACFF|nr:epoxide hydrolase 4-like [Xenia sp. Carnegie-2017]
MSSIVRNLNCIVDYILRHVLKKLIAYVLIYVLAILYGVLVLVRVLLKVLREGTQILKTSPPMENAPACLHDESVGIHNYITTKSSMNFHYVANGEVGQPLMLLLHGFPEFWYSWRFQLREFSNDYRVVAVDMRGYGLSYKPRSSSKYNLFYLVQDIEEIVEALGYTSCTLVGHDFGGMIACAVAHRSPKMVEKLVILNAPHPKIFTDFLFSDWRQFLMSWYIFFFQLPYFPELYLSMGDYRNIEDAYLGTYYGFGNKANVNDMDFAAFKFAISQPGALTAAINYYRNFFSLCLNDGWLQGQKLITSPTLIVWGDRDLSLRKNCLESIPSFVETSTIRFVGGASHWVQQDEPQIVNDFIREFLQSN